MSEAVMSKPADHFRTLHEKDQERRLIVVLENASLETVKVRIFILRCFDENGYHLLSLTAAKLLFRWSLVAGL